MFPISCVAVRSTILLSMKTLVMPKLGEVRIVRTNLFHFPQLNERTRDVSDFLSASVSSS